MSRDWYADGLRFECTGCGRCCREAGVVEVFEHEAERIAVALRGEGARATDLEGTLWTRVFSRWEIEVPEGSACPLLGPDDRCTVDAVKPAQCGSFPFWPETLASRYAWKMAAARCEGIGRGEVWDVVAIAEVIAGRRRV